MSSKVGNFISINSIFMGVCYVIYTVVTDMNNQKIYKKSRMFQEAMKTLKSHRGAIHYLGEGIEDGHLKVISEKKEDDKTIYHVKVAISGNEDKGNMYFWVSRKHENSEAELKRIELQLDKLKKRLLILDANKL